MGLCRYIASLLLGVALAGCGGEGGGNDAGGGDYIVVTDPNENRTSADQRPHLHDYWGGQSELPLIDGVIAGDRVWSDFNPYAIAEFRPEPGAVVPQGASEIRLTIAWTDDDPANHYGRSELWVKKANQSAPTLFQEVASGDNLVIPTGDESNDLPHQSLSAWSFTLMLHTASSGSLVVVNYAGVMSYTGEVSMQASVVRGPHPIPIFEGHPDQWMNRTEIQLLSLSGVLRFDGDTEGDDFRCYYGDPCPFYMVPANGTLVPLDADHVTMVLERGQGLNPVRAGLKYHDSASRGFDIPPEPEETVTVRIYTLPVGPGGDGPYATQSQWEFLFYISEPMDDQLVVIEEFTLNITAYKDP